MLDALSAPVGADDTRTHDQRFHDGLMEAMRRLLAADLLPERAGQPVKAWVHVSLAELRAMDAASMLQGEWITAVQGRWAAARAGASVAGGDGAAWLDGDAARAVTCDAALASVVTGDVDLGVLDDLVGLCVELDRRDRRCRWPGGCHQPAAACEVHHARHKAHGGKTSLGQCLLLCSYHHQVMIHRMGWAVVLNPDGTTTAWNPDRTKVLHSHGPPARPG